MYFEEPKTRRFPKVPLDRRAYAFGIDFGTVWIASIFASGNWLFQLLVFYLIWWVLRVVVVELNKGQSLGSWSMDMKVIDQRFRRVPTILALSQREAIVGTAAGLAMLGLGINFANPISMLLLMLPLCIDCSLALGDPEFNKAFHDRIAGTQVIQTQRGFSLDIRVRKLWRLAKRQMNKNRER